MGLAPTVQNVSTVNTLWMDRHLKYIKSSIRMDTKRIKIICQSLAKDNDDFHGEGVYHFKISPLTLLYRIGQAHQK